MQQKTSLDTQKYGKLALNAAKLYSRRKLKEAQKPVSKLLSSGWDNILHFFQAGIAAHSAGDYSAAIKLFNRALELPGTQETPHANIHHAAGLAYAALGQIDNALDAYGKALKLAPNDAKILNNRSLLYASLNQTDNAIADLQSAYKNEPTNKNVVLNLLRMLDKTGQIKEAEELIKNSELAFSNDADFHAAVGNFLKPRESLKALTHLRKACHLAPDNPAYLNFYAGVFERLGNLRNFDGLDKDLLLLLSNEQVEWRKLNWVIPQHLKSTPEYQELVPYLMTAVSQNKDVDLDYGKVVKFMTNNVLLASLKRLRLSDSNIEKLLETFRRQTLAAISSDIQLDINLKKVLLTILIAFAKYCFASEYVFSENKFETTNVDALLEKLQQSEKFDLDTALQFVVVCCYRLPFRNEILVKTAKSWKDTGVPELNGFIQTAISEPLQEQSLFSKIPKLTEINDEISLSVQEQYEENPYPRWDHFPNLGSTSYADNLAAILPPLNNQKPDFPNQPEVLIAGCGTGKQPISTAYAFPETKILAVDLSLASIAYAKRKTAELKIKNITYGQADIMELRSLGKKFDVIECAGVLHHMNDPIAGWQVLCDILKDDGYMMIALYSEIGRRDIVAARDFIREHNYGNDLESIRKCRKHLLTLDGTSVAKAVARHSDFFTTSACRDLIFHVQEHRFTIPQLQQAMDHLGLEFLGFRTAYKHQEDAYIDAFPDDPLRTNLENWDKFEHDHPDTFSAMYKFWVRKK